MAFFAQTGPEGYGPLGAALGQTLGDIAAQMQPSIQQRVQGIEQKKALDQFEKSLTGKETPAQISMAWAKQMSGVPGSEQLAQSVLPQYQMQAMYNLASGGSQPQVQPGQPQVQPGQPQVQPTKPPVQPQKSGIGGIVPAAQQPPVQPQQTGVGGIVPQPGQQPQRSSVGGAGIDPMLMQISLMTGQPYEEVLRNYSGVPQEQIAGELQQLQLKKSQELSNFAENKKPGIKQEELNQFVRIGQKYQHLSPDDWFKETNRDFKKYQNVRANFDNANIPGIISGMTRGSKYRAETLQRLENLVRPLIEIGEEDYVRTQLANNYLGPTEIEMLVKPLDRSSIKELNSLPKAPYIGDGGVWGGGLTEMFTFDRPDYDQMLASDPSLINNMTDKYADFLLNNVDDTVSLLGLRERLRQEKDIDYRQYYDALTKAQDKGLELSVEQEAELGALTQAPTDSLNNIFQGWGNWISWLRGSK